MQECNGVKSVARFNTKTHTADCTHQKLCSVSTTWDLSVPPQLSITPTLVLGVNCGVFLQTDNQLFDEEPDLDKKRISSQVASINKSGLSTLSASEAKKDTRISCGCLINMRQIDGPESFLLVCA